MNWLFGSNTETSIDESEIYMIDSDVDGSSSLFSKLITADSSAFGKPSLICKYINAAPKDKPIKIILTTKGGAITHCEKILKKLLKHPAGYIAYIRQECFSAGSLLALGANEIVMDNNSYMGKIDPQKGSTIDGNKHIVIYASMDDKYITDKNYYSVQEAKYVINHMNLLLSLIFSGSSEIRKKVEEHMIYSKLPHYKLFEQDECREILGEKVRAPTEEETKYFDDDIVVKNYRKN